MATPEPRDDVKIAPANSVKGTMEATVNGHKSPSNVHEDKSSETAPTVNGSSGESHGKASPNGVVEKEASIPATASTVTEEQTAAESSTQLPETSANLEETTLSAEKPDPIPTADVEMADAPAKVAEEAVETSKKSPVAEVAPEESTEAPAHSIEATAEPTPPATEAELSKTQTPPPEREPESPKGKPAVNGGESVASEVPETNSTEGMVATESSEAPKASEPTKVNADGDTVMEDAPITTVTTGAKASRERDDEGDDEEPLAKRQRTEPPEAEVTVSTTDDAKAPNSLDQIEKWTDDALGNEAVTPYRVKEYRRNLALTKKTKAGANFKDSVAKLWPALASAYAEKVTSPMDLGELERGLKDGRYKTVGEFRSNLGLIYTNCVIFNGPVHDITHASFTVVESVWQKCLAVPAEEPPKSKQVKTQPTRHHEPRAAAQAAIQADTPAKAAPAEKQAPPPSKSKPAPVASRRMSNVAASPTDKTADQQSYAIPPSGVPQIRRSSTQNEGDRPKRTIHPPRPKDIDYTTKASSKKNLRPEILFCQHVLREIMSPKHLHMNGPFLNPVDPIALGIPTYFHIIKKPMDLSVIENKLNNGEYTTEKQFTADLELMFNNCYKFNGPDEGPSPMAKMLQSLVNAEMAKRDAWLAKNAPSKPASAASEANSDDESDGGVVEVGAAGGDELPLRQLKEAVETLQQALSDATVKLNTWMAADQPNPYLIETQNAQMVVLQKALIEAKAKVALQQNKPAAATKPTKPPKGAKAKGGATPGGANKKAGGTGGGRKSTSAAPKKAKKDSMPPLTDSLKNEIAQAVGQLDSPFIEQAITIIKKDTAQTENDSGELELDIEQLSHAALKKLWEICCKAIPNFRTIAGVPDSPPAESPGPTGGKAAATKAKKKRKPMHAQEQEERIAAINERLALLKENNQGGAAGGGDGDGVEDSINAQAGADAAESSDEEDAEEE